MHHVICAHTHNQNGVVEKKHHHVAKLGLTLLAHATLSFKFWDYAFSTSVYLINRLPMSSLHFSIPYYKLFGQVPDYNFLKKFGCACTQPLIKGISVSLVMAEYEPLVASLLIFLLPQGTFGSLSPFHLDSIIYSSPISHYSTLPPTTYITFKSCSLRQFATSPFLASQHPPHAKKNQYLAMKDEYDALICNNTWTLVKLPPNRHPIGYKWVFRGKENPDGSINKHKAQLVAKGFHQRPGFDYNEMFSLALTHYWPL
ncbi:putative mitochondrial protein, partial [Mucuna pruriens]